METTESENKELEIKITEDNKDNDVHDKLNSNSVNHDVDDAGKNEVTKADDKVTPDVNSNSDSDAQCCAKINNSESFDKLNDNSIDNASSGSHNLVIDESANGVDGKDVDDDDDDKDCEKEEAKENKETTEVKEVTEATEIAEAKEITEVEEEKVEKNDNSNDSQVLSDTCKSNDDTNNELSTSDETKRKSPTDEVQETPAEESNRTKKRPKIKNNRDNYCWRCHKDGVEANCSACPRAWHRKCIGGTSPTTDNWICGECASILQAENASTRSPTMAHITVDQLCLVLKYVIGCMKHFVGSEPFWNAVDLKEVPNYLDYVVKPMDLNLLESNVDAKLYGSTDAFMADAKWIQHNCIVFNTCGGEYADTSRLTNAAKLIIKIARQEVSEYEACPDCYSRGRNIPRANPSWFVEACSKPHPLIWAKLKGFPFWPAKALPRVNALGHVDVRFFGAHDRAWIAPKDIYLFSKEPPTSLPKKKRYEMLDCLKEINRHCKKLEMAFGPFTYAPARTMYNPNDENQIKLLLPQYDPTCIYDLTFVNHNHQLSQSLSSGLNETSPVKNSVPFNEKLDDKNLRSSTPVKDSVVIMKKKGRKRKMNDDGNSIDAKKIAKKRGPKKLLRNKVDDDSSLKTQSEDSSTQDNTTSSTEPTTTATGTSTKNNNAPENKIKSRKWISKKFIPPEKHFHKINRPTRLGSKDLYDKQNSLRKTNSSMNAHGRSNRPAIMRPYKHRAAKLHNSEQDKAVAPVTRSYIEENQEKKTNLNDENTSSPGVNQPVETNSSSSVNPIRPEISIEKTNNLVNNPISPPSNLIPGKRQSKAKKSFPNKPPQIPTRSFLKSASISNRTEVNDKQDIKLNIPVVRNDNGLNYQLPPPEAGPMSTQLNRSANELVRQMAKLMEEAIKETAGKANSQEEVNRFVLELEIERMKWEHQQHLAEIKHNTDRTLREMRASLEVERLRAIEEIRKEADDEKARYILETKAKQWCASCWQEAFYYCCWNTSYCNPTCQQQHWKSHMSKCTHHKQSQSNPHGANANTHTNNAHQSQQEPVMPTLLPSAQSNSSNVRGA